MLSKSQHWEIELICTHFYSKLQSFHAPVEVKTHKPLSQLEKDALQFAAAGKTYWETSRILSISENRVADAMRRARNKLHAIDKAHAISNAIALDLIVP